MMAWLICNLLHRRHWRVTKAFLVADNDMICDKPGCGRVFEQ